MNDMSQCLLPCEIHIDRTLGMSGGCSQCPPHLLSEKKEMNKLKEPTLEQAERTILGVVKFVVVLLQEIRKENIECQKSFRMSYAKFVGLTAPYDECIAVLRKVKNELDGSLNTVRHRLVAKYRR